MKRFIKYMVNLRKKLHQKAYILKKHNLSMKGKFVAVLVCISLLAIPIQVKSEEKKEIVFNFYFSKPKLEKIRIEDNEYIRINMPSISNGGNPGQPYLPIKPVYVLLPYKTELANIEVITEKEKWVGKGLVLPTPEPHIIGEEPKLPYLNETIYNSIEPFPKSTYEKVGIYWFRGYQILIVNLYPVKYIPKLKEIYFYEKITLKVYTEKTNEVNELYRGLKKDRDEVIKKVNNPNEVFTYPIKDDRPYYEFVIITTEEYNVSGTNTFRYLANYRTSHGIPTIVVTVEDIKSNPNYWNTSYAIFNDTQAQIRNFIRHAYLNWGTEYVLLGGDDDDSGSTVVPARDLYVTAGGYTTYMPSDLYYACLDGSYNSDMDGRWGEPTDGPNGNDVDLFAEVYVGRACIDSIDEMKNFVSKTIAYQETQHEYIFNVLLVGEYLGFGGVAEWGGNYKDEFVNYSDANGYFTIGFPSDVYNISKLYDRDWEGNNWPKSELINRINNNEVHIINHIGHASETYNMKLYNSDVDGLTNTEYLFAYSQGCDAGAFDYNDCIAEHWTVTAHGAFGGVWNARYGWGAGYSTDGPSQRYDREFWDAVYGENYYQVGKANHDSKEDNAYRINEACMRWCYYETNLFGDPTVKIRGLEGGPELSYYPHGYNFGAVEENQTYQTTFEIWNSGNYTLDWHLQENYDWVWCSPLNGSSTGEHDVVTVTVDTTGLQGHNEAYIFIGSNGGSGAFRVWLYVPCGPILAYYPTSYDFGAVEENQTYETTFEIWNAGDGILEWELSDEYDWLTYYPTSGSCSPIQKDTVTVYINTTGLEPGYYIGEIEITSNGGNGTFTVMFIVVGPILAYSPDTLNFGDILVGEEATMQFEIWNAGNGTLYYSINEYWDWVDVYPTEGNSTGEHDVINVHINTTGLYEGYHSCNLYIDSNGGGGSVVVIVNVVYTVPFTFNLLQGWNLITIPCKCNLTASSLGNLIPNCSIISKWNATLQQYQSYLVGISPPEYDFEIKQGMGIFIYTNEESIWHGGT